MSQSHSPNRTGEENALGGGHVNGGHALDNSQPGFPVYHRKIANPAPLGLSAFALTLFVFSLINVGAINVTVPNVIVGLALSYGGLIQLLAGMWEFAAGNTFAATAFSSYGGFWISYAFIISRWSGIWAAYGPIEDLTNATGLFFSGWTIFTLMMLIAAQRSSIALASVFFFLTIALTFLTAACFVPNVLYIAKAGGYFGLFSAFSAWYVALAGLLTTDTSHFTIPVGALKRD